MTVIDGWENFYVIVGSSAGALIGLQFVVITLIAARPITQDAARAGSAFATPSVVHFGLVLLLSAIVSAPWDEITVVAVLWGLVGLGGVAYIVVVARIRSSSDQGRVGSMRVGIFGKTSRRESGQRRRRGTLPDSADAGSVSGS